MRKLSDIVLQEIAPPSINRDKNVQAVCAVIDVEMRNLAQQTRLVLLLPRLDELSEELVDELAWQYHVDFYDYSADLTKKRNLVRQAIAWHKRKGTPAAVEEVCTAAFKTAKVFENWEYGGEPYHFQVRLIEEGIPNQAVIDNLIRAINETKNTRSWLDELSFYREIQGTIYYGGIVNQHKKVEIYPSEFHIPDIYCMQYKGGAISICRKVEITCQTGTE